MTAMRIRLIVRIAVAAPAAAHLTGRTTLCLRPLWPPRPLLQFENPGPFATGRGCGKDVPLVVVVVVVAAAAVALVVVAADAR